MAPRRWALLVATAVISISAVLASPADAARPPASFFGIQAWSTPSERGFERIEQGEIGLYRFGLFWRDVERTPGNYDWSSIDLVVGRAARHGAQLLATLHAKPAFYGEDFRRVPHTRAQLAAFRRFVRAAVARYGQGGTFWRAPGQRDLRASPIRRWQVWNEVNGSRPECPASRASGCPTHATPAEYRRVVGVAAEEIRAGDSRSQVALAGLAETRRGQPVISYLRALYRDRNFQKRFDAVSLHPYAVEPEAVLFAVRRARAVTRSAGDGRAPIWVTEVGWGTGGSAFNSTSPRGQAKLLRRTFDLLVGARRRYRIAVVAWFCFQDRPSHSDDQPGSAFPSAGLFDRQGRPKPAWKAYVAITGGRTGGRVPAYSNGG